MSRFGNCDCGEELDADYFEEKEYDRYGNTTGRVRIAVNCLFCPRCLKTFICDASFDGPWIKPR